MPDLNLQDEGPLDNLEDSTGHAEETGVTDEETAKKGGATTIILVVLAVLIVGGGGAFLLNKLGVINLFGKKKAAPAVVQLQEQAGAEQTEAATQPADAGQTPMIETPPVDQKGAPAAKKEGEKAGAKKATKEKPLQPVKEMPSPASGGKLGEMKGEFTIQVSAWRDKEIAHEIVKRLEDAGYPAFQEERAYKDGTWFTVRVGRYASRKDAQSAVQNFAEELKTSYWIDRTQAK
ncbi:MAG: SPOR domain-containing protein [Ignavibacteriales bacterium]|nr:SPOR domain-containing protein [Ignavibacteriales bacterium]